MFIFAIIIFCIIAIACAFFGKANFPNNTYKDDKKELKRLLDQEKMVKKIHESEKKEK